jgi:hypothetical protein
VVASYPSDCIFLKVSSLIDHDWYSF